MSKDLCQWIEGNDFIAEIRAGRDPHCSKTTLKDKSYCAEHEAKAHRSGASLKYFGDVSGKPGSHQRVNPRQMKPRFGGI